MTAVGFAEDPNLPMIALIVDALGELCDSLVFVGGCATGLLSTAPRAELIRATQDVDIVAQVTSLAQYHRLGAAVEARGFTRDRSLSVPPSA